MCRQNHQKKCRARNLNLKVARDFRFENDIKLKIWQNLQSVKKSKGLDAVSVSIPNATSNIVPILRRVIIGLDTSVEERNGISAH